MKVKTLNTKELTDWLRLIRSENIGPKTFNKLVELYGSPSYALDLVPGMSLKGGKRTPLKVCNESVAKKEIEAVKNLGAKMIPSCDPRYPRLLRNIDDAPPIITVLGNVDILSNEAVAMVGARNFSMNASKIEKLAYDLVKDGVTVVSGLARGIDTSAHKGALLAKGEPSTIAVVAGGIDHIYPKENEGLYKEIIESGGAIIAECAFGTVPRAENFPRRNRIISGLCSGTVVVEAAKRSGSLITARMAAEQGREVMAIPGFPLDPRAGGTNKLLKEGATLVESAKDIIEATRYNSTKTDLFERDIGFAEMEQFAPTEAEINNKRDVILSLLGSSPVAIDDLIIEAGAPANVIQAILLELELAGRLSRHAGGRVSLIVSLQEELM